jgi:peptidoglycan hydrolase-like protein with peptidoglycan-binding domain
MHINIKSIISTIAILIALCTGVFAQDKTSTIANDEKVTTTETSKTRPEYLPANVEKAQQTLKAKGLYKGNVTGKIDADTKSAIKTFQEQSGLNPTGHLNKDTRKKLGIEEVNSVEKPKSSKKSKETASKDDSK